MTTPGDLLLKKEKYETDIWIFKFIRDINSNTYNTFNFRIMILQDQIFIRTTPDHIFSLFKEMDQYYTDWNSSHVAFK